MSARRNALVVALAFACLLPGLSAHAPETGTIMGRVTLAKRVRGVRLPANAYQTRTISRRANEPVPEIRSVLVYLKHASVAGELPAMRAEIRQQDEAFVPRVVAITRGSVVDFPNSDPFFHNVFSLSGAATFDLGRFQQGASRSRVFTKPGLVKVFCHLHSHMSATILVLDHPYFTAPGLDGSYSLEVPPGRHTLVAWHERVGERTSIVDVAAGHTVVADLSLPVDEDTH